MSATSSAPLVSAAFTNLVDALFRRPADDRHSWPPPGFANPNSARVSGNFPWSGADNPNHFYTTQDLFDQSKTRPPGRHAGGSVLYRPPLMAGTNNDSYNSYTFSRLLSQLGTDSAPEPAGKMNLNYCNVDNNGYVVPDMATNFIALEPIQFFTNAAIRLLANAGYTVGRSDQPPNLLVTNYVGGVLVTNLEIPLWPTNYYTPSVHRLLQLAANLYDSTTNRTFRASSRRTASPTVFRPVFSGYAGPSGNAVSITGYEEVLDTRVLNQAVLDLADPASRFLIHRGDDIHMVAGIPLIIGAKKGFPNFNEFGMRTAVTITRKLQFLRQNGGSTSAIAVTNQMYCAPFPTCSASRSGIPTARRIRGI